MARPEFGETYFKGSWGNPLQRDPAMVVELDAAGRIQPAAPLPYRREKIRALAFMFGPPD